MRYTRVLFIIPDLRGAHSGAGRPHPGVGYLVESLQAHGVYCDVLDMNLGYRFRAVRQKIESFKPELIGITLYTYKYLHSYRLIDRIGQAWRIPIVVGGPHVSIFGGEVLTDTAADVAITHEGEQAIVDLCTGKPLNDVVNLIQSENDAVREDRERFYVTDLDALAFPRYEGFELRKYGRKMGIVSSRGCPYRCTYCSVESTMGRQFRCRSPQSVVQEMAYWYDRGFREFDFVDDVFLQDTQRVLGICDMIDQHGWRDIVLGCSQGIRANMVDRDLLSRMRAVGFKYFGIGVESTNNATLKAIKKGQSIEQVDEAVRIACELGYDVSLFFMIGLPGDSPADIQDFIRFARKYPVRRANFYNVMPYPNTELFDWVRAHGSFAADARVYLNESNTRVIGKPCFCTSAFSLSERKAALRKGKQESLRIERQYRENRYSRLGIVGKVLAWLMTTRLASSGMVRMNRGRILPRLLSVFSRSVNTLAGSFVR